MSIKEEFANKLNNKYAGDLYYPSSIVDDVREFENESGVKFSVVYIGLGKDASWYSQGCKCEAYDCLNSYEVALFPKEQDKSMRVASIWYDKECDFLSIDFYI